MTELEKRIDDLESKAAEMTMIAQLAGEPATRTYNAMQAEDLIAIGSGSLHSRFLTGIHHQKLRQRPNNSFQLSA